MTSPPISMLLARCTPHLTWDLEGLPLKGPAANRPQGLNVFPSESQGPPSPHPGPKGPSPHIWPKGQLGGGERTGVGAGGRTAEPSPPVPGPRSRQPEERSPCWEGEQAAVPISQETPTGVRSEFLG